MQESEVDAFLRRFAPDDVRATIAWLLGAGFELSSHRGDGTFGALFVYTSDVEVHVTVDRSQWMLGVAPGPAATAWQFDLLVAAVSGRSYGEVFPTAGMEVSGPLLGQLPVGVSWRETLPGILQAVRKNDVAGDVEAARRERTGLMSSRKRTL